MIDTAPIERVDLLLMHGHVVTVDCTRRIITDGAVAIRDGAIVAVGKSEELASQYTGQVERDLRGDILIPGLVDAHLHLNEGPRGFVPDDVPALPWIFEWVAPMFNSLSPEIELLLTKLTIAEALRTGTTTFVEGGTLRFPTVAAEAVDESGIRANLGTWVWDLPQSFSELRQTTEQAVERLNETYEELHGAAGGRISVWMHLVGVGSHSDELLRKAKDLADKKGVGLSLHQSETRDEVDLFTDQHGGVRPIVHYARNGILDANVRLVHAVDLDDREIDLIAQHDVKIVHSVLCALKLGYGASVDGRFPEMLRRGISVSIACDGANGSNTFDMFRAMFAAATLYKDRSRNVAEMPAETVLEMATLEGANSILMQHQLGSIEVGKRADLVVIDVRRPEALPLVDVVSNLVYSIDGRSVKSVYVDGNCVVDQGSITTFNEDELYEEILRTDWKGELRRGAAIDVRPRWPYI